MNCCFVNLYQHFGRETPENAAGTLVEYIPEANSVPGIFRTRPAVLILPGGGYGHVSSREAEPVALRYAAKGWCAFVLTYTVAPAKYPVALREAAMAMAYIRSRSEALQIGRVAAVGFSAGGHLCGCLGTLFDDAVLSDIGSAQVLRPDILGLHYPVAVSWGNTHRESFRNLCGEDETLAARLSLDALVRRDMPPVFLWHTRQDASVPCRNSLILANALEQADVPFAMHVYHRGCHGLSTADELAYPSGKVPPISRDVTGWLDAELLFFEENGLKIQDL